MLNLEEVNNNNKSKNNLEVNILAYFLLLLNPKEVLLINQTGSEFFDINVETYKRNPYN